MDEEPTRPAVLTVMAEHVGTDPVWDRPFGTGDPVDLATLGVSTELVDRLRAWSQDYAQLAPTEFEWESPEAEQEWTRTGLELALDLQDELWDVEVRYWDHGPERDRPMRERRRRAT